MSVHAKLYQDALDNLSQKSDAPLYVCKVCGYTTTKLPDRNCVSCREPVSHYVRVDRALAPPGNQQIKACAS